MTTEEAIEVIRHPNSTFQQRVEAAGVLATSESTPLNNLVECLKLGGLPAEIAAMKLYKRTERPGPKFPDEFITNHENWTNYLLKINL